MRNAIKTAWKSWKKTISENKKKTGQVNYYYEKNHFFYK